MAAKPNAVKWLAKGEGSASPELAALKEALAKESDVFILFGAAITGAAIRDLVAYGSTLQARRATWPSAITSIRAERRTWAFFPIVCPATRP